MLPSVDETLLPAQAEQPTLSTKPGDAVDVDRIHDFSTAINAGLLRDSVMLSGASS
jgi:hypothetical protein